MPKGNGVAKGRIIYMNKRKLEKNIIEIIKTLNFTNKEFRFILKIISHIIMNKNSLIERDTKEFIYGK